MDVKIKRPTHDTKPNKAYQPPLPRGLRMGYWGRVEDRHSEDNTVDVLLDISLYLKRVCVASEGWVIAKEDVDKDYNAGERNLPPLKSRVFVWTPTLITFDDCFIAPFSGFPTIEKPDPFMKEEKEEIRERINPNKWHTTEDHVTGSYKVVSPDKLTSIEIDYGSKDEPLVPPELHAQLFHDEEKDDPGIRLDVVSGETVDMSVFKDVKLHHKKNDLVVITAFDSEVSIKKGELFITTKGHTKVTTMDMDTESEKPIGVKGTGTQLGGDVLQEYWGDEKAAWEKNPLIIPPIPLPPGAPVLPVPPLINMYLKALQTYYKAMDTKAKSSCSKALK